MMFWGHLGPGTLVLVERTMNPVKYIQILQDKIVYFKQAFSNGVGVFQYRLVPCRNPKKINNLFLKNKKLVVLDWPENSPDLNQKENLRMILKRHINTIDSSTKIKLIDIVRQI